MKSLFPYAAIFVGIVIAAVVMGNWDPVTPAVVEARSETSAGPVTMNVINQGLALMLKWIFGATVAGLAGAAFVEGRKIYRMWWRDRMTRRWRSGPNAYYQKSPSVPKLTREDLILMALARGDPSLARRVRMPSSQRGREEDDEIDLEF